MTPNLAQSGFALLMPMLNNWGSVHQEPRQHTDAAQGLVPVARAACKKLPPALPGALDFSPDLGVLIPAHGT